MSAPALARRLQTPSRTVITFALHSCSSRVDVDQGQAVRLIHRPAKAGVAAATRNRAGAVFSLAGPLAFTHRARIAELAVKRRLPTVGPSQEYAEGGWLMGYGPNYIDQFRRAAAIVDKILKGAKPADLPLEQPTKFELVINLKTAKALALTIPQTLLLRADQVIE